MQLGFLIGQGISLSLALTDFFNTIWIYRYIKYSDRSMRDEKLCPT